MKYLKVFSIVLLCLCFMFPFFPGKDGEKIYTDTIRLHILAESDSQSDQNTKLLVRDFVLSFISSLVSDANGKSAAEEKIRSRIDDIRVLTENYLADNGESIPVSVTLGKENYPTKDYGDYSLPAGKYTSLIIRLGKAEGHNWWCVLYPRICVGAASARSSAPDETFIKAGFSSEQINIITDSAPTKYRIKFKILEILGISAP